jgi:hypothetical protein
VPAFVARGEAGRQTRDQNTVIRLSPKEAIALTVGASPTRICARTIRPSPISRFLFQTAEHMYHRLRNVSVVIDNPPSSRFPMIDVRDAIGDGHLLSSKRKLPRWTSRS